MASIPACHAGDRGSIPRLGDIFLDSSHFDFRDLFCIQLVLASLMLQLALVCKIRSREGQEIVQCSNALPYATIAISNEPRVVSDKSSDFVLFPSDPTQAALETTESHCAILHAAASMTAEVKGPKNS